MRQEISIGLSQRLVVTPELRQSIEILQMSTVELKAAIEREHLENPTLELEYFDEAPQTFDAEKFFEPADTSTTAEKFLMEQAYNAARNFNWAESAAGRDARTSSVDRNFADVGGRAQGGNRARALGKSDAGA